MPAGHSASAAFGAWRAIGRQSACARRAGAGCIARPLAGLPRRQPGRGRYVAGHARQPPRQACGWTWQATGSTARRAAATRCAWRPGRPSGGSGHSAGGTRCAAGRTRRAPGGSRWAAGRPRRSGAAARWAGRAGGAPRWAGRSRSAGRRRWAARRLRIKRRNGRAGPQHHKCRRQADTQPTA